jgi:predicted Zn finger-like uncharacterized protein
MIVRCPSCSTRFDLPANRLDADGTMIKCSSCGHDWIEGRAVEISRQNVGQLPALIEPSFEPDSEIRRLVDATREAQEAFANRKKRRRMAAAAWFGLAMFAGTPLVYAVTFPETVVSIAPATLPAYQWMGTDVNIYGLDIRQVELQHLLVEGKRVIAVKGEISNVSGRQRKIPWLRFGLKNEAKSEVYSWTLDTNSRPLDPGQTTNFVTRIASPPEMSNSIEIRFARPEEIGSNTSP